MRLSLDERYTRESGWVYLTGIQALVRLPLDQMRRDRRAGLRTGVFVSGYEGSPLGGYDLALARVRHLLEEHDVHFLPGVNEDLAATAVFGSQIIHSMGSTRYDGVTGIWYGKGPGVDRSGDILRHANLSGTGPGCAALVLGGDDHTAKSSSIPHQSDLSFYNYGLPVLCPGNVQEVLDYGLIGIELSRYSGCWVAMKLVTNVCDGGGMVNVDPERFQFQTLGASGKVSDARLVPPYSLVLEQEMAYHRLEKVREFARSNRLLRISGAANGARLGIASAGKPYYDLIQALRDAGIDPETCGIRLGKFALTYPLERGLVEEFADGLPLVLVIEEKRSFLELQLREALYNRAVRPIIVGKQDEQGAPLVPATGELNPEDIVRVLRRFLPEHEGLARRAVEIAALPQSPAEAAPPRLPTFCPGCPHARSTYLAEGQISGGGIGCHGMASLTPESGSRYVYSTHMGAEGVPWIGMSPFVDRPHMFQNMGDGTYFHSGSLAITAAVAAGVNITYRILYNGAVAMTGGQQATGALPVPELTRRLEADGVRRIAVLTDDPDKYAGASLAPTAPVFHRDELQRIAAEFESVAGVTVIVYEQQCAAEKRRLRSRGRIPEPVVRLVIHEEVCEGCGDCVRQSSCLSLHPVETEWGQKTRIHQASCNKDYSCLLGDCPSFVTVRIRQGTGLRKRPVPDLGAMEIPDPVGIARAGDGYAILVPGIGGTGVVTANALIATAAWLDGLHAATLDQTGLAQKGGAVVSSVIVSERPVDVAAKIGIGMADLILGCDLLVAAAPDNLSRARRSRTAAVINTAEVPTGDMVRGALPVIGGATAMAAFRARTDPAHTRFIDANRLAESLFGSHLAANIVLLGAAYQAGLIPVSAASIEEAIRLNRVEEAVNLQAFRTGRLYVHDPHSVEQLLGDPRPPMSGDVVARRVAELERYQDASYAAEFADFVESVTRQAPELRETVARGLFKLMAYKDEYEVARLLTNADFRRNLDRMWEAVESISYNLHPPFLRAIGWKHKIQFGGWARAPLVLLARLRFLRGTRLDPFGYQSSRREERELIAWYRDLIARSVKLLANDNLGLALEIAAIPEMIRGYEGVKRASIAKAKAAAAEKLAAMEQQPALK